MFGTEIVCYLFLGGAGAGACFVLAVMGLLVPRAAIVWVCLAGATAWTRHVRTALLVPRVYRVLFAPAVRRPRRSGADALGMAFLLADLGRV